MPALNPGSALTGSADGRDVMARVTVLLLSSGGKITNFMVPNQSSALSMSLHVSV